MKKVFLIIFNFVILVILSSCAVDKAYFTNEYIIEQTGNIKKEDTKLEDIMYIRTDGYHESVKYPVTTVISTKQDLVDYYNAYKDLYYFDSRASGNSEYKLGFIDAMDKYDDAFFNDNVLILVLSEETSGSIRHKVTDISVTDSTLNISIKRLIPEFGTDDMAQWHIFINIPKSDYVFHNVNVDLYQ